MAETKPIPVRLTFDMIARLDRAAETAHLSNRTEVIKLCISSFLDYFEANGGEASLPLNWQEMIRDLDGRTNKVVLLAAEGGEKYKTFSDRPERFQMAQALMPKELEKEFLEWKKSERK